MISMPTVIDVPLRIDSNGVIRIGNTRVTLETIVSRHQAGDTPEAIQRGFPTVPLADIYAVLAYYLSHQDEVDTYMRGVEAEGEAIRRKFEALPSSKPLTRDSLLARLANKQR